MVYVGVAAKLLSIDMEAVEQTVRKQFAKKVKAAELNLNAVRVGYDYVGSTLTKQDPYIVERMNSTAGKIIIDVAPDTELDTKVKIETPSKHAEAKAFSGASDNESSIEVIRPVYHMDVEAVQLAAGESAAGPACK